MSVIDDVKRIRQKAQNKTFLSKEFYFKPKTHLIDPKESKKPSLSEGDKSPKSQKSSEAVGLSKSKNSQQPSGESGSSSK